jgi:hypothetical protein
VLAPVSGLMMWQRYQRQVRDEDQEASAAALGAEA